MSGEQLIDAAEDGNVILVKQLLDQNVPVNSDDRWRAASLVRYQDGDGHTALIRAAWMTNSSEIVQSLIKAGASINHRDMGGETALMGAAYNDDLKIVQLLLQAGASLDLQNKYGWTALMFAATYNHIEVVRALLQAGASLDLQTKKGHTAYELTKNNNIKSLINDYQIIRETIRKNIERLENLRSSGFTYLSVIPRDLIGLIGNELEDESSYFM